MMHSELFLLLIVLAAALVRGGPVGSRANEVRITFVGAANAQFTEQFPLDGEKVKISMFITLEMKRLP